MNTHTKKTPTLLVCILFDAIGYFSYLFPGVGEWSDLLWAPVSAIIFYTLFGGRTGKIGGIISFVEEILPFTDFIPTFTIGYFVQRTAKKKIQ